MSSFKSLTIGAGRFAGPDDAVPLDAVEALVAQLLERRDVGHERMALQARHRERLHLAGLDVRQRGREPGKERLRLAAEDVGDRRADAAIRDVHHIEVGSHLQLLHREMRERSPAPTNRTKASPGCSSRTG
jgi:hypothetical protein